MFALLALAAAAPTGADTWAGFRNDGSGRTAARDLPVTWSPTENLAWRVATPGYGQSAPVVWKDRVYLTAVEGAEKETLRVACLALADGRTLWAKAFPSSQRGKNTPTTSRAAPTPVADAGGVYAFFESGDLVALSPAGDLRWQRAFAKQYGELKNNHGLGSSPAQTERTVIVLVDHQGPSYLLAVDKLDGETAWKADRPARSSWASPVIHPNGGEPVVVASSGGAVTGYDAHSGKQLWEMTGLTGNTIPSPALVEGGVMIGATDSARQKTTAESVAGSNCFLRLTAGPVGYEVAWRAKRATAGTASPVVHRGHAYLTDKNGFVHCLDGATGEARYSERLPAPAWATPVGAGDHVYVFGKDGVTTVLKAGPEFDVVATNRLWSAADFDRRKDEAKRAAPPRPAGGRGGPPGLPPEEAEAARASALGDVVYGVAAVDRAFVVRTGTEVICVRNP